MHSNTLKKNPTCTQARAFISFVKQINSLYNLSISKITSCLKKKEVFCDDEKEEKIDTYTCLILR